LKGVIAGLALGAAMLIAGGVWFNSGIGQPGIVVPYGHYGGNLPLWGGLILMGAGLVTKGGIVSVLIRNWEGGTEQPSDD
jgi:hypothetical protein